MVFIFTITFSTFLGTVFATVIINEDPASSNSSCITAYRAQSVPLVMLLATYDKSKYSSFMITSDIPLDTDVSAIVWTVEAIEPISNTYEETVTLEAARHIHLYALADSSFQIIFGSLDGPVTANATVEFQKYNGGGHPGNILASQSVVSSEKNQSIIYTNDEPGFIEFRLINNGLNGSFTYNFTINELNTSSLRKSDYNCTLNSINKECKHSSLYSTNNMLASVTFDHDFIQGYPTFNITLTEDILRIPVLPIAIAFALCMAFIILPMAILQIFVAIRIHKRKTTATE